MHPPIKFCNACGREVEFRIPENDHLARHLCAACGHIQYRNPKVIVGIVPEWEDGRVLMCRRNIDPRFGLWTFPAGFLELGESSGDGAAREALEEAQADVEPGELLAVINVPYVSQIYLIHRGRLKTPHFAPTFESSEVRLMREDEIPWDDIAFPTIWHGLKHFFADRASGAREVHVLDLSRPPKPPARAEIEGGNI